jgi:hypothetical protein
VRLFAEGQGVTTTSVVVVSPVVVVTRNDAGRGSEAVG